MHPKGGTMHKAFLLLLLATAAPAHAQAATVSEPSNLAIVMIGLAGLVIGRQAAKRARRNDPEE